MMDTCCVSLIQDKSWLLLFTIMKTVQTMTKINIKFSLYGPLHLIFKNFVCVFANAGTKYSKQEQL